ncbi:hypothetical protein C8Q72DRAFT_830513 [Fomitopsis betulina]|nr:hypothetical protein C8Q72DRAFT_830513 [Fomitopsis betulina]
MCDPSDAAALQQLVDEIETVSMKATVKHVHCECALLHHLEKLEQPMQLYIGVSTPSCAFCDLYFAAYREQQQVEVYAHGTHGHTTWPASPGDAVVKADF